ncbi:hypothetical protein [Mycoplasma elephantis]|uniref:hypothetical protein n=1 Tax=Mycoplasma elephantis TaxID=114882 RepID=UPI000B2EEDCD|nr:hypothetical protein [Mycoplasma elephantis]
MDKRKFSEYVDKNLRNEIEKNIKDFYSKLSWFDKMLMSTWQWFVYILIGFILGLIGILCYNFASSSSSLMFGMFFLTISIIGTLLVIMLAILLRKKIFKRLREAINEKDLINKCFCSNPIVELIEKKDNYNPNMESDLDLYDFELSRFGIPNYARLTDEWGHFIYKLNFKYPDFISMKMFRYMWVENVGKYSYTREAIVGVFKHDINKKNIDIENMIDYTMFYERKSNIDLESSEFNKKIKLNVSDEIKARLIFTPAKQAEILDKYNEKILKKITVSKDDNITRIVFRPINKQHLIIQGKNISNLKEFIESTILDLKNDVYSILELLCFSVYNSNTDKLSYKID